MAAIIRRHRFMILVVICSLLLMTISWHFHRKEKPVLNSTPVSYEYENFNNEIQLQESIKQSSSDLIYRYNDMEIEQLHIINEPKLPEDEKRFDFIPIMAEKESTKYQVEERFIPIQQEISEFTTKIIKQPDQKFVYGIEEVPRTPAILYPDLVFSLPSKVGVAADKKYLDLADTHITSIPSKRPVSLSAIIQNEERFVVPDNHNERMNTQVAFSESSNKIETMDMWNISKHIEINKKESSPTESSTDKSSVLLIDTPGCKIPRLDPWDPTLLDLIELQEPYVCPGPPIFLEPNPGGSIILNKTILKMYYNITPENLVCYYQPIYRDHEPQWSKRENSYKTGNVTELEFGVPLNEDYIAVSCSINGNNYDQYIPLVRIKKEVEDEKNLLVPPNPSLNVILLGIDSISKLNFIRHFPKTHAFLKEKLKPFEMNGYTKVGDNTFPNIVPLLTGQFVEYWWNETVKDTMFFDNIGLIWKEYAKRGYRTFFAEDVPLAGIFNYIKRGFYNQPTDYYFRPLSLVLHMWKLQSKPEKEFCINSQLDFDMIFDYLKVFAQTMETRPFFGFTMVSSITHDKLNYAGWADEPTVRLLEGLLNTGALDNTLLVLFSDHGLRFGKIRHTYVGKFEERLPLMYIHVPKWFLEKYPEFAKNLEINQDRLMTLFDIHATMLHLLDLNKTQEERSMATLGRSLFEEISPDRTCSDAYIQTHFCPCQEFDIVDIDSPVVINASQAIVDDINSKLQPYYSDVCEILKVGTVTDARVGKANDLMLTYLRTENEVINKTVYVGDEVTPLDDYMITLVTKPGGGVFEGTVRHNPEGNTYGVLGVSRISMYGNTSWCIDSQKMKIFCYCKLQQLT